MYRILNPILAIFLTALISAEAISQEPHHSRVSVVHPGFDLLKLDLKSVVDLADPEERKQWDNIQDYIDMFQIGIDGSRPVRVDALSGVTPACYLTWVPLPKPADAKEFRDSLDAFGYQTTRDAQDKNLYRIDSNAGAQDMGWFRIIPGAEYGVFVLTTDKEDMELLRQLVTRAEEPKGEVADLLASGCSLGAELVNKAVSAEDQEKRRSAAAELRKISMDTVQKRPEESKTEFELRKHLLKAQLDESERLMVEAAIIRVFGSLDRNASRASLKFTATAIPDTSLHKTIAAIGVRPDDFASVKKFDGSIMSIRMNHPIDEVRQSNVKTFLELVQADFDSRIDASKDLSADEKVNTKQFLSGLLKVTLDGIASGHICAMLEATTDATNDFMVLGSVSAPDATRLNDILPLLAKSGKGNLAEMNVRKVGNVSIHRIQLYKGFVSLIDRVFGDTRDLFIGIDKDRVWLAAGPGALDRMAETIEKLGPPAMSASAIHAEARLLPWIQRLDEVAKTSPEKTTKEEKERQRANARTRARAIDALKTDDQVTLDIASKDGVVTGEFSFDKGSMTFVGKAISAFAKENLQE
ncbi:MAG: hypothetical protein ACK526_22390 [Planctomyces sp.]